MATKSRRKSTSVSEKLLTEPYRFSFFQAARLLQGIVKKWRKSEEIKTGSLAVGYDVSPLDEPVKFSAFSSLRFASSEIQKISTDSQLKNENSSTEKKPQAQMQVSFMGLTGQSSILPVHFTELEISRTRDKDFALKEFYDLFNHRAISFFYRAWEKYRLPFTYERHEIERREIVQGKAEQHNEIDPITASLHAVVGVSGKSLQRQLEINAEDILFYAGFFSSSNRSASSLGAALTDILGIPVLVNQFKGEWVSLLDEDRMCLPTFPLKGKNNCLGMDLIIGDEVFTVEGKFQLEIGPLNRQQFKSLQPGSQGQEALKKFTHLFVGDSFQFELKYVLKDDAISGWELSEKESAYPRLGLNTWLLGRDDFKATGFKSSSQQPTSEIVIDVTH